MRSFSGTLAFLAVFSCLQFGVGSSSDAQEVRKHIAERHGQPYTNYRPDDPWTRGWVFNLQTGHAGLFRNCDDEECKRDSPYICWKQDNEKMFPTQLGLWGHAKQTHAAVTQRIRDGAGGCAPNCRCRECQTHRHSAVATQRYAAEQPTPKFGSNFVLNARPAQPDASNASRGSAASTDHAPRFGLVRGKIVAPTAPEAAKPESATPASNSPRTADRQNNYDRLFRNRARR